MSEDGRTWTFRLREGARWSDGTPVTAEDFRRSWLRLLKPATAAPYAGLLFDVEGARGHYEGGGAPVGLSAPDARTFVVRLTRPVPWFGSLAAFFTLLPVPEGAVARHGERWTRAGNIVTNGPFVLERWAFYREILLRRSPSYWNRDAVGAERIRLLPVVEPTTQLNLYETGAIDLCFSLPGPVLDRLRERPDFVNGPRMATAFLRVNVTRAPLDRPEVRRALSLAVDREVLAERVARGGERPLGSFVPPGLPGYEPVEGVSRDVPRACALLAEAGYPGGRGLRPLVLLLAAQPDRLAVATVIQHQLREALGVEVRLAPREGKVYFSAMRELDYDLALSWWIGDYPDATTFLYCFRSGDGNNRTGWESPAYDALLRRAEEPGERRAEVLAEAERLLVSEAPVIPLYQPAVRFLVSPRVSGFTPNPMGLVSFADLRATGER